MPEHLRALVVILVLAVTVFKLAERPITAVAISLRDYRRRRNLWFAVTLIAFFAHNFWVYLVVAGALIFHFGRRDRNPFALYCMLIFAVSVFTKKATPEQLVGLTYGSVTKEQDAAARASFGFWEIFHTVVVLGIIAGIYIYFW